MRDVTHLLEAVENPGPIDFKGRVEDALDVLKQHCFRFERVHIEHSYIEEIALVALTELLSGNRERGTREAASDQIDAFVGIEIQRLKEIVLDYVPTRPIETQRVTCSSIILNQSRVLEPCLLKSERLAARSRTQFKRRYQLLPLQQQVARFDSNA